MVWEPLTPYFLKLRAILTRNRTRGRSDPSTRKEESTFQKFTPKKHILRRLACLQWSKPRVFKHLSLQNRGDGGIQVAHSQRENGSGTEASATGSDRALLGDHEERISNRLHGCPAGPA